MAGHDRASTNGKPPAWWRRLEWDAWRIALVPVRSADALRLAGAVTDEIARFLHDGTAESMRAEAPAWAADAEALALRREAYRYTVYFERRFAGSVELRTDAVRGHVGYWLRRAERGRGVATSAVRLLLPVAFEGMGLPSVDFIATEDNVQSIAVMERLGARRVSAYAVASPDGTANAVRYRLARARYRRGADGPESLADLGKRRA